MKIEITGQNFINLKKSFECGQCFRFIEIENNYFIGAAINKPFFAKQYCDCIEIDCLKSDESFWLDYFDLKTDYNKINLELLKNNDKILETAIKFGNGIHILKQDFFETLISFIISQNNNIPRIKGIVNRLCENFGNKICYNGFEFYSFPTPSQLKCVTEEDLAVIRAGFRNKYIVDAVNLINSGKIDSVLLKTAPYLEAREHLKAIKGVGCKVADCVLLFGCYKLEAFPVDVWVKKTMEELYGNINCERFGKYAGVAQQYLFYAARENGVEFLKSQS